MRFILVKNDLISLMKNNSTACLKGRTEQAPSGTERYIGVTGNSTVLDQNADV